VYVLIANGRKLLVDCVSVCEGDLINMCHRIFFSVLPASYSTDGNAFVLDKDFYILLACVSGYH